jgi:hypothetical protein
MKYLSVAIVLACLACAALQAQSSDPLVKLPEEPEVQEASQSLGPVIYGPMRKDGSRTVTARKDALDKQVRLEGIAWGQPFGLKGQEGTISPHAGPHVIHQGGSIFVKGIDFTSSKARGKPVRVAGTLRLEPKTGTRFGDVPGYYYLEAKDFDQIDAVSDPHPVLVD